MKKLIALLAASAAALSLAACTTLSNVNTNPLTGITAEKIAGSYALADTFEMGQIKAADFAENTLTLAADGTYTFTVTVDDAAKTLSGTYTVADNGVVTLDNDAYIAMKGETVTATGDRVTVSKNGAGTQARVEMVYLRSDDENADEKPEDKTEDTVEDKTVETDMTEDKIVEADTTAD